MPLLFIKIPKLTFSIEVDQKQILAMNNYEIFLNHNTEKNNEKRLKTFDSPVTKLAG